MNLAPENSAPLTQTALDDLEIGMTGVTIALAIISVWAIGLGLLLSAVDVPHTPWWSIVIAMGWQTFLFTGLFITAHDAMHGAILPYHPRINRAIGCFVLFAYGLFTYEPMLKAHRQHHQHPASDLDPDFYHDRSPSAIAWYLHFMQNYWSWLRFGGLVVVFHIMHLLFHVPEVNLILFWILPSLLSSLQLFYFGTFLPHRGSPTGYADKFRAQSRYYPLWLSFLTCYHFGYHHEHHRYPHLAWWQLPNAISDRSLIGSV